jgi:polysaccharide export outer membrane protein
MKITLPLLVVALLFGAATGRSFAQAGDPPTAPAAGAQNTDAFAGPIRNGDSLRVIVAGEDTLSGDFRVENDGTIQYPRLGVINVAGKMQGAVSDDISQRIVGKKLLKHADVAVYIVGRKVRTVAINGAVTNQGQQNIKDATVLSEVIETAVPGTAADLTRVMVTHADGTSQVVNYQKYRSGLANTSDVNPALQDGDRIYIYSSLPSAGSVRVVGEVKDQTRLLVPISDGMTVGQVLQIVGGVTDYADRAGIVVVRGAQRIPVPYDDILRHTAGKDIVLMDKDEIDIPKLDKPRSVSVNGAVRDPKTEPLLSRLTLLDAIAQAGGPQDGAQENKVQLRRRDSKGNLTTRVYDMSHDSDAATELIDGDVVEVPYPRQRQHIDPAALVGILSGLVLIYSTLHH